MGGCGAKVGGREEAECKKKDTLPARPRREPMAESGSAFSRSSDFASLRSPCCPTPPTPAWRIKAPASLTRALCLLPKDPGPKGGAAEGSGNPSIRAFDHRRGGGRPPSPTLSKGTRGIFKSYFLSPAGKLFSRDHFLSGVWMVAPRAWH